MGKVISFVAIKGGVGKTTISSSLAALLANEFGKKVLLIDGNYSAPNLGMHMNIVEAKKSIHHVLAGRARFNEAVHYRYGVDVVPGDLFWRGAFNPLKLKDKIKQVKRKYDFVIIDSSPSLNEEVLSSMLASDDIFVVTTPDYPTMACTLRAAALARQRGTPIAGLVVNKIRDPKYELNLEEIEGVTGLPVLARIPDDKTNIAALFKRIPTSCYNKNCNFAKEIRRVCCALTNQKEKKGFLKSILNSVKRDEINREVLREGFYRGVF